MAQQIDKKEKDSYNHVLKSTGLLGGVQVFNILTAIIRNKFTAIFIGPWGMGLADIYAKSADFMSNMTNFGIGFSAVKKLAELHERGEEAAVARYVRLVRTWTFILAMLGWVICLVFAPALSRRLMGDYYTTKGFLLLSPMVPMLTVMGGELAILKGLRRLKSMAVVSAIVALVSMLVTIFVYWKLGVHGVLPVLLLTTGVALLLNMRVTTQMYPYRISLFSKKFLRSGSHLITLGGAYTLAGIFGTAAELLVRSGIRGQSSLHAIGLYVAGYTLIVSYARLVFVAMDADFFPRLSATGENVELRNQTINRQIDVLVMLMAPFLIVFSLLLPLIVRLLYTEEFMIVVPMAVCAMSYMYFKAVYSPISYLPLARGNSFVYLTMETLYDIVFVVAVVGGYYLRGLVGAGIGLSLANFFDLLAIAFVYRYRYAFRFDWHTLKRCLIHYALLLAGLAVAAQDSLLIKITLGTAVAAVSIYYSWYLLRRATSVEEKLREWKNRIFKRRK